MNDIDVQMEGEKILPEKWQATRTNMTLALGTFGTVGLIDVAAHGGPGGMFFGALAAFVMARHGDDLARAVRDMVPQTAIDAVKHLLLPGSRVTVMEVTEGNEIPSQSHPERQVSSQDVIEADVHEEDPGEGEERVPRVELPHAPGFREMAHLLGTDRLILCYTTQGPVYGTIEDLLSMAVVGKPGRGKTTALMYYVAMLLKNGAEVYVMDPHGVMVFLGALNGRTLPGMPATARVVYLDRKEEMVAAVGTLQQKLLERDNEYRACMKAGKEYVKHPLLLLADELPVLADYDDQVEKEYKKINAEHRSNKEDEEDVPSIITLMRRFVLEARKWKCFFIGSGQSTDAQILPTRITENLSSRIVFYSSDRRARMAGLEQEDIKRFLPALRRSDPGTMIFDCSRFDEPILGAIPATTPADLKWFLAGMQEENQALVATPALQGDAHTALLDRMITLLEQGKEKELIAMLKLLPGQSPEEDESREPIAFSEKIEEPGIIAFPSVRSTPVRHASPDDAKVARGFDLWQAGNASVRKLEAASGWSNGETRRIIKLMKGRGLIRRDDAL